jgi:hypothetical protein
MLSRHRARYRRSNRMSILILPPEAAPTPPTDHNIAHLVAERAPAARARDAPQDAVASLRAATVVQDDAAQRDRAEVSASSRRRLAGSVTVRLPMVAPRA